MTEHYFTVSEHGAPDPEKHPWVVFRLAGRERWVMEATAKAGPWKPGDQWYPVDAPPTEPAPRLAMGVPVRPAGGEAMIPSEPSIDDLVAIVRANGFVVATTEAVDREMDLTVAHARAQGRAEGFRAGLERAAEIADELIGYVYPDLIDAIRAAGEKP